MSQTHRRSNTNAVDCPHVDGLVQERRNSSAWVMELVFLALTYPSNCMEVCRVTTMTKLSLDWVGAFNWDSNFAGWNALKVEYNQVWLFPVVLTESCFANQEFNWWRSSIPRYRVNPWGSYKLLNSQVNFHHEVSSLVWHRPILKRHRHGFKWHIC